jgi:hypothetical protein
MCKIIAFFFLLTQSFTLKAGDCCPVSKPAPAFPPAVISKFYGELQYGTAFLYWHTYGQGTNSDFFIERSSNGKDFEIIGKVGNTAGAGGASFQYKDTMPLPTGFYRIKTIQADTAYSDIMRLSSISGIPVVKVWPLVFDARITVEVSSQINEAFTITLTNSENKVLSSRMLNAEKGNNTVVFEDAISFLYADEYTMTVTGIEYNYSQKIYKK